MPSLTITTRKAKDGPRYVVRFRLGGRAYPIVHAGSFRTLKEAKARRDFVAGELAGGRNPAEALRALSAAPTAVVSVETWSERFIAARIDVDETTRKMYRSHTRKIGDAFGDRDPSTITASEIAEWVSVQAETRKAGTLGQYLNVFRSVLDHAGVEPNPARDSRVKLPKRVTEEANSPTDEHFLAILDELLPRGGCSSSRSSKARSESARPSTCGGRTWTRRACACGCRSPRRRRTRRGGCTCPSG
jgi:hypothetical protein